VTKAQEGKGRQVKEEPSAKDGRTQEEGRRHPQIQEDVTVGTAEGSKASTGK
jgi:hypothetical protein